jgi:hypothetical protein
MNIGLKPINLKGYTVTNWLSGAALAVLCVFGAAACTSPMPDVGPDNSSANASIETQTSQSIVQCPRQFTGWELLEQFETETYSLALCQQGRELYLVGHEKGQHEGFIEAAVSESSDDRIVAVDDYGFSYEIATDQLTIMAGDQVVAQEALLEEPVMP